VCGLNKQFNRQDAGGRLVLSERLGAGLDYRDAGSRIRIQNRIRMPERKNRSRTVEQDRRAGTEEPGRTGIQRQKTETKKLDIETIKVWNGSKK
jgi:hypothetical protein